MFVSCILPELLAYSRWRSWSILWHCARESLNNPPAALGVIRRAVRAAYDTPRAVEPAIDIARVNLGQRPSFA
jgi:hypothetical protein